MPCPLHFVSDFVAAGLQPGVFSSAFSPRSFLRIFSLPHYFLTSPSSPQISPYPAALPRAPPTSSSAHPPATSQTISSPPPPAHLPTSPSTRNSHPPRTPRPIAPPNVYSWTPQTPHPQSAKLPPPKSSPEDAPAYTRPSLPRRLSKTPPRFNSSKICSRYFTGIWCRLAIS